MSLRRSILFFVPANRITQQTRLPHLLTYPRYVSTRKNIKTGEFIWSEYINYINTVCLPAFKAFDNLAYSALDKSDKYDYSLHFAVSDLSKIFEEHTYYGNKISLNKHNTEIYEGSAGWWPHAKHASKGKLLNIDDIKLVNLVNHCIEMIDLGISQFNFEAYPGSFENPKSNYFILNYDSKRRMPYFCLPNPPKISADCEKLKKPSLTLSKKDE